MNSTNLGSLDNLRDVVVPSGTSWWPPALGWQLILLFLFLWGSCLLIRAARRYRRNAYRRAALVELHSYRASPDSLPKVTALLKRTALAVYPREEIASLSGKAWLDFLARTCPATMPNEVANALAYAQYQKPASSDAELLASYASQWIQKHRDRISPGGPAGKTGAPP